MVAILLGCGCLHGRLGLNGKTHRLVIIQSVLKSMVFRLSVSNGARAWHLHLMDSCVPRFCGHRHVLVVGHVCRAEKHVVSLQGYRRVFEGRRFNCVVTCQYFN
jgi:hypothetical protein